MLDTLQLAHFLFVGTPIVRADVVLRHHAHKMQGVTVIFIPAQPLAGKPLAHGCQVGPILARPLVSGNPVQGFQVLSDGFEGGQPDPGFGLHIGPLQHRLSWAGQQRWAEQEQDEEKDGGFLHGCARCLVYGAPVRAKNSTKLCIARYLTISIGH